MRSKALCFFILLAGCGEGAPPFDELPLRDSLRASPEVIAMMPNDARQRLAARLESARVGDRAADLPQEMTAGPAALVLALDRARERRAADALVMGSVAKDGEVRLFTKPPAPGRPLPPLDDGAGAATEAMEARALAGNAGAAVRTLVDESGATRLRRVVGWPIGAVHIGDTVYVSAAWLVALAPGGVDDAGASGPSSNSPASRPPLRATVVTQAATATRPFSTPDAAPAGFATSWRADAGVYPTPTPPPPAREYQSDDACADSCGSLAESCAAACAESDQGDDWTSEDSGADACSEDSGDDSCGQTEDGADACSDDQAADDCSSQDQGDACADPGAGGDPSTGCQIARRGRRSSSNPATLACMLAPLAYLLRRGRR